MNKSAQRALLARPLAFCLGVAGVVWLNPTLGRDWFFPSMAAIFALPNLLLWVASDHRVVARIAPSLSPAISLLGWGVLAIFTQGLASPILAAFFFEVGLAAITARPLGVVSVTIAGAVVLLIVQTVFGLAEGWQLWLLESGFLAVTGGLSFAVARRRLAGDEALRVQREELGQRLEALRRELDDERVVARVGENVARLAHGLKNAVHSLRGFVGLIEREGGSSRDALAGLRATIDDLERLARLTLAESVRPSGAAADGSTGAGSAVDEAGARRASVGATQGRIASIGASGGVSSREPAADIVERSILAARSASPEVDFELRVAPDAGSLRLPIPDASVSELLTILLRNAVEAMHASGRCTVDLACRGENCRIEIADEGDGVSADAERRLFTPGFTTKPGGSGFGLFLARRILEDHGGSLALVSGPAKGAIAIVEVPFLVGARSDRDG